MLLQNILKVDVYGTLNWVIFLDLQPLKLLEGLPFAGYQVTSIHDEGYVLVLFWGLQNTVMTIDERLSSNTDR